MKGPLDVEALAPWIGWLGVKESLVCRLDVRSGKGTGGDPTRSVCKETKRDNEERMHCFIRALVFSSDNEYARSVSPT